MNRKERVIATLCLEEPDVVPFCEFDVSDPYIRSKLLKQTSSIGGYSFLFETTGDAYTNHMRGLEEEILIAKEVGNHMIIINDSSCVPKKFEYKVLPKYRGQVVIQDEMGRIYSEGKDGMRWYMDGIIKKPEDFEHYEFPDLDAHGRFDFVERATDLVGEEVFVCGSVHYGFGYAWELLGGLEKLLLCFHINPSFAKKLLAKINKQMIEIAKIMIDYGVDGILTRDDIAGTRGSFVSPKMFEDFLLPSIQKLAKAVKRRGAFMLTHSDGNMYPLLDYLIDAGIDCFNPIEPGPMNLKTCKEKYGDKIALWGNVNCATTLVSGSVDDTRREVMQCIEDAAPSGGYMLGTSNSIYPGCKLDNVLAMIETGEKYGRYPLQNFEMHAR